MINIEDNSDQDSFISTSEKSYESNIFKNIFDDFPELNEYGLNLKGKLDEECFKNNFCFNIDDLIPMNEYNSDTIENSNIFLAKKSGRNDVINGNNDKTPNYLNAKIFVTNKLLYRHDYYIMAFKTDFLKFLKNKINYLINNISLCGQHYIHTPNRKLYGGNPKEKDNREFIYKTVEEVFIDQGIPKDKKTENSIKVNKNRNNDGISRQKDNKKIFNKIKEKICLAKFENSQKYNEQSDAVEILTKFLQTKIRDVLDEYYDSKQFEKFSSSSKIRYYDEEFKKERNRNFSLLEKNNFVKLVEMPFSSNKNN